MINNYHSIQKCIIGFFPLADIEKENKALMQEEEKDPVLFVQIDRYNPTDKNDNWGRIFFHIPRLVRESYTRHNPTVQSSLNNTIKEKNLIFAGVSFVQQYSHQQNVDLVIYGLVTTINQSKQNVYTGQRFFLDAETGYFEPLYIFETNLYIDYEPLTDYSFKSTNKHVMASLMASNTSYDIKDCRQLLQPRSRKFYPFNYQSIRDEYYHYNNLPNKQYIAINLLYYYIIMLFLNQGTIVDIDLYEDSIFPKVQQCLREDKLPLHAVFFDIGIKPINDNIQTNVHITQQKLLYHEIMQVRGFFTTNATHNKEVDVFIM
mgnify:CR=1 FL=1